MFFKKRKSNKNSCLGSKIIPFDICKNPFNAVHQNGTIEYTSLPDEAYDKCASVLIRFQSEVVANISPENFSTEMKEKIKNYERPTLYKAYIPVSEPVDETLIDNQKEDFVYVELKAHRKSEKDRLDSCRYYVVVTLKLCSKEKDSEPIVQNFCFSTNKIEIYDNKISNTNFHETEGNDYLCLVSTFASEYDYIASEMKKAVESVYVHKHEYVPPRNYQNLIANLDNFLLDK